MLGMEVPAADYGNQKQRVRWLNILWVQIVEPGTYESDGE